ncbi:hypothetical protein HDU93_004436, partial [Gonapodya sp. JEL0774]
HLRTRFVRVEVTKVPFLVERLKVQVLPCVACFVDGVEVDRIVGFETLGNTDNFTTPVFERRLSAKNVIKLSYKYDEDGEAEDGGRRRKVVGIYFSQRAMLQVYSRVHAAYFQNKLPHLSLPSPTPSPLSVPLSHFEMQYRLPTLLASGLIALAGIAFRPAAGLSRLEPPSGMMVGYYESVYDFPKTIYNTKAIFDNYTQEFGWDPSVMHVFGNLPFKDGYDIPLLTDFLTRCAERGIVALTSMEPSSGLDNVTDAVAATFADLCASFEPGNFTNGPGTACLVRFALEFNGPFHPVWMWQPTAHKTAFRRVSNALHSRTKLGAIMWGPNSGLGYPFANQLDPNTLATLSAEDKAALDTNKDGKIDGNDDPYQPWWPGAQYVDWIAMT